MLILIKPNVSYTVLLVGIIYLDMEVQNAADMMHQVVDLLIDRDQVAKRNEEYLKNALLLRHRWVTVNKTQVGNCQ